MLISFPRLLCFLPPKFICPVFVCTLQAKLAAMNDEERAEAEKEAAAEAKREARKNRMLSTQMTAYGSSAAAAAVRGGRGRGRGRGRGGAA